MLAHPALPLLSGTFSRNDLFLVVFCVVDDWMKQCFHSPNAPRPRNGRGPRPDEFTDSELLALVLVGEMCHVRRERAWLRQVRASHAHLFPCLPEDSRFARRAQQARHLLPLLRQAILFWADADLEPVRVLDSFPLPLCATCRSTQTTQPVSGQRLGYNANKKQDFMGLRPGVLITLSGFVDDLILAPGNCNDTPLLAHYLDECVQTGKKLQGQEWIMDKGFRNKKIKAWAAQRLGLNLLARPQEKSDEPLPFWYQFLDRLRKPVENVLAVLCGCFGLEHLLVRSDVGVYRRTQAKATAFSLARYFNLVLGCQNVEPMNIARYAV